MIKTRRLAGKIGFVLCAALLGALTGSPTYGQPSVSVGVSVSVPSVRIRAVSDFYEPLAPQGEWVVNQARAPGAIEKASGRKFQAVPVRELRQKEEAPVVARQRTPAATAVKNVQPPVRTEAQPNERKAVAAPVPTQTQKPAPVTTESRPEGNHGPAVKEPAGQNANQQPVKQEKSIQPPNTKAQQAPKQPAKEKAAASGNNGANPAGKGHNDKSKD